MPPRRKRKADERPPQTSSPTQSRIAQLSDQLANTPRNLLPLATRLGEVSYTIYGQTFLLMRTRHE